MYRLPLRRWQFALYRLFLCVLGGLLYGSIELLWRGRTHPSMVLLGGFCFLCFAELRRLRLLLPLRCLLGALTVTAAWRRT